MSKKNVESRVKLLKDSPINWRRINYNQQQHKDTPEKQIFYRKLTSPGRASMVAPDIYEPYQDTEEDRLHENVSKRPQSAARIRRNYTQRMTGELPYDARSRTNRKSGTNSKRFRPPFLMETAKQILVLCNAVNIQSRQIAAIYPPLPPFIRHLP